MTLAMLLDAVGELDREGLECETCTPFEKGVRGCGQAPQVPDWDGVSDELSGRQRPWTTRWFWSLVEKTQTLHPEALASELWPLADLGGAIEVTGQPWACCPAWYARFSSESARDCARRAYQLCDWKADGELAQIQDGPLLGWQVELIGVATRARSAYQRRDLAARTPTRKTDAGDPQDRD